jgi:hypothetical protein
VLSRILQVSPSRTKTHEYVPSACIVPVDGSSKVSLHVPVARTSFPAAIRSQPTNLLGSLCIDSVFLLSEDWRSKADRQSCKGNCKADFHRYVRLCWNGSSRNALLRDFSQSLEGRGSLLPKILSDIQNGTHCPYSLSM